MTSLMQLLGGFIVLVVSSVIVIFNGSPTFPIHSHQIKLPPAHVSLISSHHLDSVQLDCLAKNIFFEARGESDLGKTMVGLTVMQRKASPYFPDTICGIVYQGIHNDKGQLIKNECQFSWACNGKSHAIDFHNSSVDKEWQDSYHIAKLVMQHKIKVRFNVHDMTHYHNNKVHPYWAKNKKYVLIAKVDHQYFYRWKNANVVASSAIAMN